MDIKTKYSLKEKVFIMNNNKILETFVEELIKNL